VLCGTVSFRGAVFERHASACVYVHVALLIQHETCMHRTVTSFVIPLASPSFSTLSHNRRYFMKNVIKRKMCVLIFSTNFI
jgi:hypothetical protein